MPTIAEDVALSVPAISHPSFNFDVDESIGLPSNHGTAMNTSHQFEPAQAVLEVQDVPSTYGYGVAILQLSTKLNCGGLTIMYSIEIL